jgi:hypothetical protein
MNPPTKSEEYWAVATLQDGKLIGVCEGFPPGEVGENEFLLTKPEFNLLRTLLPHYKDMNNVKRLAAAIQRKLINTIKDNV